MLILRCVHPGSYPAPCQVQGSVGAVYSLRPLFPGDPTPPQAQGDTRRNNNTGGSQFSSSGVSSHSNYYNFPVHTGLMFRGRVVLICTARGARGRGAGESSLTCALVASTCPREGGAPDPRLSSAVPCCLGPVLLESYSQGAAPESSRAQSPPSGASA